MMASRFGFPFGWPERSQPRSTASCIQPHTHYTHTTSNNVCVTSPDPQHPAYSHTHTHYAHTTSNNVCGAIPDPQHPAYSHTHTHYTHTTSNHVCETIPDPQHPAYSHTHTLHTHHVQPCLCDYPRSTASCLQPHTPRQTILHTAIDTHVNNAKVAMPDPRTLPYNHTRTTTHMSNNAKVAMPDPHTLQYNCTHTHTHTHTRNRHSIHTHSRTWRHPLSQYSMINHVWPETVGRALLC